MDEMFLLQAIPQTNHEQPKIEDPVGRLLHLGKTTKLSLSRKFQVFWEFLLKKLKHFRLKLECIVKKLYFYNKQFTGRILLWHGYIQLSI